MRWNLLYLLLIQLAGHTVIENRKRTCLSAIAFWAMSKCQNRKGKSSNGSSLAKTMAKFNDDQTHAIALKGRLLNYCLVQVLQV